jgi:hypothetical protein
MEIRMAVATLSAENKLREQLKQLHCADNSFALINQVVGRTRFFEAMSGKPGKHFNDTDAAHLLETIQEMRELAEAVDPLVIAWEHTDKVRVALALRRIKKIAAEMGHTELVGPAWAAAKLAQENL